MKLILFGSYINNPQDANDVDIAIVTNRVSRKSFLGRVIRNHYIKKLSSRFSKPLHIDIYSKKYLEQCEKSSRLTIKKDKILKISDLKKSIYGGLVYEK